MKVVGTYDDSYPGSKRKRIFYTFELSDGKYVDIMVSEECRTIYAMQNEDGSVVYGNEQTYPDYAFDENMAIILALGEYEKEFGKAEWYNKVPEK